MRFDKDELYKLLPAIYRIRDAEQGDFPLQALLGVISEQAAVLKEDLAQLYDDQFIETCQGWIAPYIGDLIGYRPLHGVTPSISSPWAEVANTIRYRRRKGTILILEQLARDVTDWPARAVEFFQLLATTQFMNHLRSWNHYAPDLRQWEPLERLNTAFESTAHTVDVRRIATQEGRYNIPNIGIFLWRLRAFSLTGSPAVPASGNTHHFFFSPLGNNRPLFTDPEPEEEITHLAQPINVPEPISRRVLDAYLENYYGPGKSILLHGVDVKDIRSCNLSDVGTSGAWAHDGAMTGKIAIDPVLGRISFPDDKVPSTSTPPLVTFHYGFSAEMGGGEYARASSFDADLTQITAVQMPAPLPASITSTTVGEVLEIRDSGRYAGSPTIHCNANRRLEIRAADGTRPAIVLGGNLDITGDTDSEVTLNGLLIAGGMLRVLGTPGNNLKKLRLRHCTLVPGGALQVDGEPNSPNQPSLDIHLNNLVVEIDHCILGRLEVVEEANVSITNSIVDATAPDKWVYAAGATGAPGGPLRIENSTIIGKVHTFSMDYASNSIFLARLAASDAPPTVPVRSQKRQAGCVRFCYLPPDVVLPRRYRCQPDLALAQRATALGLTGISALSPSDRASIRGRIAPTFTSLRYGHPAYGQLARRSPIEIREGADDDAEMGAFHDLFSPQRETNLRVRLDEYLRFGLEAGVFYAT
jgi:hypothetical protein